MSIALAHPSNEPSDLPESIDPHGCGGTDGIALITDAAIRHLFGITLELASVLELNHDAEVGRRIDRIITDTDDLIREFRLAGSEAVAIRNDSAASSPSMTAADPTPQQTVVATLLQEVSFTIDRSLDFARRSEGTTIDLEINLENASWAVHRALMALRG